jgi:hypothetical protein
MYDRTVGMILKNNKYQKEWHNASKLFSNYGIVQPENRKMESCINR